MSAARDEDEDELTRALGEALPDVVPLRGRSPNRVAPPRQRRPPEPAAAAAVPESDEPDEGPTYVAPGIDRRELRKLARGDCRIDARLDLHGMTLAAAEPALHNFLQRARHAGYRHVCIITGVGHHSPAGAVLRPKVAAWLRANPQVLAFAPPPQASGGFGALHVRLRR